MIAVSGVREPSHRNKEEAVNSLAVDVVIGSLRPTRVLYYCCFFTKYRRDPGAVVFSLKLHLLPSRCNVASLLIVALQGKMEYVTEWVPSGITVQDWHGPQTYVVVFLLCVQYIEASSRCVCRILRHLLVVCAVYWGIFLCVQYIEASSCCVCSILRHLLVVCAVYWGIFLLCVQYIEASSVWPDPQIRGQKSPKAAFEKVRWRLISEVSIFNTSE